MTSVPPGTRSDREAPGQARASHAPQPLAGAKPFNLDRRGAELALTLLMTASYFLAARYGLTLLAEPNGVAVFWPASGLAVGALLVFGRESFGPVGTGVALATILANATSGRSLGLAVPFALANVVECLAVAWLTDRLLGPSPRFDSLKRVVGIFLAAATGTASGAVVGALTIMSLGASDGSFFQHWHQWFRSDLIGIIAIAPLILGLRTLASSRISASKHVEGVLLLLFVCFTAAATYPGTLSREGLVVSLPISILFPPLLLLAIRHPSTYSQIGASAVAFTMLACIIIERAVADDTDILWAQITIVSMVASSLSLAALIAERNASEERRRLLVRELDHRVKNGLSLVQAVVDRSRENASSVEDFYAALGGRIRSMVRTHSMLSREKWHDLELSELIKTELSPYQEILPDTLEGPRVLFKPALVQSLSLVLHELLTNAVKHGALMRPQGRVLVKWHIEEDAAPAIPRLVIQWQESGRPLTGEIGQEGFGTSTIRELLRYEADAVVELAFPREGARCTIRIPITPGAVVLA